MLSQLAEAALLRGHTAVSRVDVLHDGKVAYTLTPTAGSVAVEADAPVRRSLSCSLVDSAGSLTRADLETLIPDPSLIEGNVGDPLNAYECEIAPYRGVRVAGVDEFEPLGVFRLTGRVLTDSDAGLTIRLTGQDRAMGYQVPMSRPLPINAGTPVESAIQKLLAMVQPGVTVLSMRTGHTCGPLLFEPDINVWAEAQKLAESVGARLFHDRTGRCVLAPAGTASDRPVARYAEGDGLLLDVDTSEDSDTIRNVVVAENEDGSISVEVADNDSTSPTYHRGRYGRHVYPLKNPHIHSIAQATQAATARLAYELGRSETVKVTTVVHPGRDVDEVITVHRPRSGLVDRGLVVATLDIPLSVTDAMSIGCRESRLAQDGRVLAELAEMS